MRDRLPSLPEAAAPSLPSHPSDDLVAVKETELLAAAEEG